MLRTLFLKRIPAFAHQISFRLLFPYVLLTVFTVWPVVGHTTDAEVLLSQEEQQQVVELFDAFKTSTTKSKETLGKVAANWTAIKDRFGGDPAKVKVINAIEKHGFSSKLQNTISALGSFEKGAGQIGDTAARAKRYIDLYDRYKADPENPTRSLKQIGNLLEDINAMIGKLDPSGGALTGPLRELIAFYQQAATQFASGLSRLDGKIKERSGNCFGPGGTATYSQKHKAYNTLGSADTICPYGGLKLPDSEIWVEAGGTGNAYLWWQNQWTRINPGILAVEFIVRGWQRAHSESISLDFLIRYTNNPQTWASVQAARKRAAMHWRTLHSEDSCMLNIVDARGLRQALDKLLTTSANDPDLFTARYVFRTDTRGSVDRVTATLEKTVLVFGSVKDADGAGVASAAVVAKGGGASVQATTGAGGNFSMVFDLEPDPGSHQNASVSVSVDGKTGYQGEQRLWKRCEHWALVVKQEQTGTKPAVRKGGACSIFGPGYRRQICRDKTGSVAICCPSGVRGCIRTSDAYGMDARCRWEPSSR